MSIKKISKDAFQSFIAGLISTEKVYGIQAKDEAFDFAPLNAAKDLRLDYDVSLVPPKKYFQPAVETLLDFKVGGAFKSVIDSESFVLIGVHPYDMVAINQMDELFSQNNYDSHYMTRRKNATIIAVDVVTPSKNIFASSMNTATVDKGFDILLTDIGNGYVVEAATDKAIALIAKVKGIADATKDDIDARKKIWDKNKKGLNKHELKCKPSYLPKLLDKAYTHPVWEEKAKTCFACGSCNQVCPTCYCFNVFDEVNWALKEGERKREWDGCLLSGFTKVAGEHEFRNKQADRFRHRLYRKGKYIPGKIDGQIACVGCGRCVNNCLPGIANPVDVYNRLVDDLGIG